PPMRARLVVMLVVIALAFAGVLARLAVVQGFSARRYAVFGESQRMHTIVLPAERGAILDRNLGELAVSTRRSTVWADPSVVTDAATTARLLAPVLDVPEGDLLDKLRTPDTAFVYLARKVDDRVAEAVEGLALAGVQLLDEPKRIVPSGDLAAPLLGQVGLDDEGLSGLEKQYEKVLTGKAGELLVERDAGGNDIAAGLRELKPSARGHNLVLTIDRAMQYETERALAESIVSSKAKGGMALVMDPLTGEILAMANLVAGKPGTPPVPPADNMAVTRVFEPGSTNKVVTIAAAVEEGVVTPSTRMNVADTLPVADVTFHDSEPHPLMWWTTADIVAHSSNVGTIQIAQRLGKAQMDRYLRAFGMADPTDIDFPGESGGLLPDLDEWSGTSIGSIPIGQGVAVTAVQMLGAFNTIANGGTYVAPSLVKGTVDAAGKEHPAPAPATRRVVSEATAAEVSRMLTGAVQVGTGTAARIDGYTVAGKTGTARKPSETKAGYTDTYMASFAGFLPAEAPRLSAIVVLDEPRPYYGGIVAAPVFAAVGSFGIRHFGIPAKPGAAAEVAAVSPTVPPGGLAVASPTVSPGGLAVASPTVPPGGLAVASPTVPPGGLAVASPTGTLGTSPTRP
ncbi:MAG TPA: penicillin-binding protein 2, partial [Actinomycetes bacterium]|nr:penicillin-binding protein 2 [Actinomycetes bacterium]